MGGRLAIGETFEPRGTWACELGEELVLTTVDGRPALHVASVDVLLTNHWEDDRYHHFGMAEKDPTYVGDGAQVATGAVFTVPKRADEDAFIDRYRPMNGHAPIDASRRFPDGSRMPTMKAFTGFFGDARLMRPNGDPWMLDMCWSPNGPLAKSARDKGVRPRDLLFFGARLDEVGPPAQATPIVVDRCSGTGEGLENRIVEQLWMAEGKLWVHGNGRKLVVEEARDDGTGCLLRYAVGDCIGAAKSKAAGYTHFYWEHVQTGFLVWWQPDRKRGMLTVYSPGDLRPAPPLPRKSAVAGPSLSPDLRTSATMCGLGLVGAR